MKLLLVVAGMLVDADAQTPRVLLTQRPAGKAYAGQWEFPGGKLEADETPEAALCRELKEELGISVRATDLQPLTFVSHAYPEFHVLLPVYLIRHWQGAVAPLENQQIAWSPLDRLADYPLLPTATAILPYLKNYIGR